jgi:transcriptional regulator with XRE-family HTH domain
MPSKKSKANQKLGRAIRSIREQKRYSQERFARHAGFERSNYGAIERGEFNVRLDTIVRVAAGLGMTVAALCEKAKI